MARVTKLNVQLTASSRGLSAGVAKANQSLDKLTKHAMMARGALGKAFAPAMSRGIGMIGSALRGVALTGGAAAIALGALAVKQIGVIGDSSDLAKKLGVSYNALKTFEYSAKLAGIEAGTLSGAMEKMNDVIGTALGGNKAAQDSLAKLGLTMEQIAGMSTEERFIAIGKAIAAIPDPAERMAAARDVFGKSGGGISAMFADGGAGIAAANKELEKFGSLLTEKQVATVAAAGDALDKLGAMGSGAATQLADFLSPAIISAVEELDKLITGYGGAEKVMDTIAQKSVSGATTATDTGSAAWETAKDVWGGVKTFGGAIPEGSAVSKAAGAVLGWNPVRDTVGAIYGKNKSEADLARMQERYDMSVGKAPTSAMGAAQDYVSRAAADSSMPVGGAMAAAATTPTRTPKASGGWSDVDSKNLAAVARNSGKNAVGFAG